MPCFVILIASLSQRQPSMLCTQSQTSQHTSVLSLVGAFVFTFVMITSNVIFCDNQTIMRVCDCFLFLGTKYLYVGQEIGIDFDGNQQRMSERVVSSR